jgi:ABC-type antimicrobial peptide transport system permease subunit
MISFSKVIFKKIFENKIRFGLMMINLSLGVFLFSLITTLGINIGKNNISMLNSINYYKQIQLNANNFNTEEINNLKKYSKISKIQIETTSEFVVKSIGDHIVDNGVFVTQIDSNHDLVLNDYYGRILENNVDIMISQQYLEALGIDTKSIIGKKVILTNGEVVIERNIVATYNRNLGDQFSPYIVMYDLSTEKDIKFLLIEVFSIDDVEETVDYITQLGLYQNNYLNEIKEVKSFSNLLIISFLFIGVLILSSCASIVSTSVKVSIKGKYPFISLLKAFGYSDKKLSLIIYFELALLLLFSLVIGFALYSLALFVIPMFMNTKIVFDTQYIEIFSFSFYAFLSSILFSLLVLFIISIKPIKMIKKCDVIHLLREVEQ